LLSAIFLACPFIPLRDVSLTGFMGVSLLKDCRDKFKKADKSAGYRGGRF